MILFAAYAKISIVDEIFWIWIFNELANHAVIWKLRKCIHHYSLNCAAGLPFCRK